MEITDELEPVERGINGGVVGNISCSGEIDIASAFRTQVICDGVINI